MNCGGLRFALALALALALPPARATEPAASTKASGSTDATDSAEPTDSSDSTESTKSAEALPPPVSAKQSWRFAGLPIANYSSDFGIGAGLRGAAYLREEGRELYLLAADLQVFASTGGSRSFNGGVDLPRVRDTDLRLILRAGYSRNLAAPWFGPDIDGEPEAALPRFTYDDRGVWWHLGARHPISQAISGFAVHRLSVVTARAAPDSAIAEARPIGFPGNRYSEITLGILYDTRDHEAQPTRGHWAELSLRGASVVLGSEAEVLGAHGAWASFFSLHERVVLAARASLDRQWGGVPFQRQRDFGGYGQVAGLGGSATLRGLLQDESTGRVKTLLNAEARLRLLDARPFDIATSLGIVLFADVGRGWPDGARAFAEPLALYAGYGAGLRIILQEYFVIRLDGARAEGRNRFYIQFGELF